MTRLQGRPVTGFASGTGIASIRPVFDALLAEGAAADSLAVYYQDRARGSGVCEHALGAELDAWRTAGVSVQVLDDTTGSGTLAAREWERQAAGPEAEYVICGNPELDASAQSALIVAGVPSTRIHRNY